MTDISSGEILFFSFNKCSICNKNWLREPSPFLDFCLISHYPNNQKSKFPWNSGKNYQFSLVNFFLALLSLSEKKAINTTLKSISVKAGFGFLTFIWNSSFPKLGENLSNILRCGFGVRWILGFQFGHEQDLFLKRGALSCNS